MYRNCVYLPRDECVRIYTWDEDGNRVHQDVTFNPYLYIESAKETKIKSIYNTSLKKKIFKTQFERSKFVKQSPVTRFFENVETIQQCLIDCYHKENDNIEFSKFPLKIQFLDIETFSPDAFPNVRDPQDTINVITVYDSLTDQFTTWGLGECKETGFDNCTYINCKTERELLEKYIEHCEDDFPDIISGWNSNQFDIPYLVNRITTVLSENDAKRLSPIHQIQAREMRNTFGGTDLRYSIKGVSLVDYLDVYKHFTVMRKGQQESYKLNDVAENELGESKVEYGEQNLSSLAENDWQKFVQYNIQDVNLLVRLDDTLKYIELVRMLAYTGLCEIEHAMGALKVITGACVIQARNDNVVAATFQPTGSTEKIPGAYVAEPRRGFGTDIVSFDVNSLYPSAMISLNLSPETKIGKIINVDSKNRYTIQHVNGRKYTLSSNNFSKFIKQEDIAISKANILFTQKKKGLIPKILDTNYSKRVEVQQKQEKLEKKINKLDKSDPKYKDIKSLIDRLDLKQLVIKVLINSIYGALANQYFGMCDKDLAKSITLTGQSVIKKSNDILRDILRDKGVDVKHNDPIVYNDTDSSYISITKLLETLNIRLLKDGQINDDVYNLVNEITEKLNNQIKKWGTIALNSHDCRFEFKREVIADKALFLQKKRYILHILDNKGQPCDKFKYKGVEVVRSTLPKALKGDVKKIIETMIIGQNRHDTNKIISDVYEKYKNMPLEQIANTTGLSNLDKYLDKCVGFKTVKGMPVHAKAAYYYNTLLSMLEITSKYEKISSGDKVKFVYLKQPNRYGLSVIGFKYSFPEELKDIFEPDRELMFNKQVFSIIERNYESVNWPAFKPDEQQSCDLLELFS